MENDITTRQEYINLTDDNQREFEDLLRQGRIDEATAYMDDLAPQAAAAYAEYDIRGHAIMRRPDKVKQDRNGDVVGMTRTAKIPVPYQVFINEMALVFLFGQPLVWQQRSDGTDDAFRAFTDIIKVTHFNSRVRECKRVAGSETESALLFRCYRDENGDAALQLRVIAHSKKDRILTRFDQYGNLLAFAWGYQVKGRKNETFNRVDVFTKATEYHCTQRQDGWDVESFPNLVGKIPVILFRQQKEWAGAEEMMDRVEMMCSTTADTNDYFSDPFMVVSRDILDSLPEKGAVGRVLATNDIEGGADKAMKYVTWDSAPESKSQELEWLEKQILSKTFTPDIQLDTLRSLSNLSGKALRTVMLLAVIKAERNKEVYDDMMDRVASLLTSIIGNVLDVRLKAQCAVMRVDHVWQEPFGEDVAETLENLAKGLDAGIMSRETAVQLNPLVTDNVAEMGRIEEEDSQRQASTDSLFGARPASYTIRQATEREGGGAENGE